jgi:hypothetical protein
MVGRNEPKFATEADLVAAFCADLARKRHSDSGHWTIYHETAGFDLLLVERDTGVQVGLEAKLTFNLKVLAQALPDYERWRTTGPDYRGILVPASGSQLHLPELARRLGLGVITFRAGSYHSSDLPDERAEWGFRDWHPWFPERRCDLPEYVPDVVGGKPAPLQLTEWKIRAIKLLILLQRRGYVSRADFKALGLSPARWTAPDGYLARGDGVYVAGRYTPDLKAQHPQAWAQIEADYEKWLPPGYRLIGAAA